MNLDEMRHEDAPRAFQAPVDVHASADGQVYMFRGRAEELETSSDDEELNVIELRPRSRDFTSQGRNGAGEMLLLERHISHEDNLNKLALQYGCKVADIKRVNNLIKEQDLYALKFIKIPVKKHSLLTETNSELHHPQQRSSSSALGASDQLQNSATADSSFSSQVQQYMDFFKEVDNDIEQLIQSTETQEEAFTHGSDGSKSWGFRGQRLISYALYSTVCSVQDVFRSCF
ncbi:lysM and putative peptidoglycan-binding domain-containing protein 4 isoform X2 [Trichomycterus rosablanca]|uniref:lysM and putative peptidoglycan-binding domain-containing protein 4 isoform X2 n=1 Tax=Trichomycterus rosablanca TaxID=2290929 RepID=UPI002F353CA0